MKSFENNRKFLDFLFEYDGYACKCEKDIKNEAPDTPPKVTLKICADHSKPLHFSYSSGSEPYKADRRSYRR